MLAVSACVVPDVYLYKARSEYFMFNKNKIQLFCAWLFVSFGIPHHYRSIALFLHFYVEVICK
jgi:hypothetical protein